MLPTIIITTTHSIMYPLHHDQFPVVHPGNVGGRKLHQEVKGYNYDNLM